jgi:hypothetical protein
VFSVNGFGIIMPKFQWVGWVLGLSVTVLEVVLLERGSAHKLTLFLGGAVAYGYGILTNVMGIWQAQGSPDLASNPFSLLLPILLGVFLEIIPEPLFFYGATGSVSKDLLEIFLRTKE